MNKKNIIIIALVLLVIVVFMWTSALSNITVGSHMFGHMNPEQAAAQRSNVNTSYSLFTALIFIGAGTLIYLNKQKDKS